MGVARTFKLLIIQKQKGVITLLYEHIKYFKIFSPVLLF